MCRKFWVGSRRSRTTKRSGVQGCTATHRGEYESLTRSVERHGEHFQIEARHGTNFENLCERCFIDRAFNLRAGVEGARPAWQRTRSGPLRTGPHFEADSTGAHLQNFDLLRRLRPPHQKPCLIPRGPPPPPPPHPKALELGDCRPPTARSNAGDLGGNITPMRGVGGCVSRGTLSMKQDWPCPTSTRNAPANYRRLTFAETRGRPPRPGGAPACGPSRDRVRGPES